MSGSLIHVTFALCGHENPIGMPTCSNLNESAIFSIVLGTPGGSMSRISSYRRLNSHAQVLISIWISGPVQVGVLQVDLNHDGPFEHAVHRINLCKRPSDQAAHLQARASTGGTSGGQMLQLALCILKSDLKVGFAISSHRCT